jgi:Flp pilus assembly protein TadG
MRGAKRFNGFLGRLRRDTAGNTLAIMAAALIPLAAFSGSAIDIARLYVVKVRLQQACDSGVLAGRKFMTDTNPATPLDSTASTQATTFFNNNFRSGWFTTNTVSFTPSKTSDSQVAGTASATVPMTIMAMFGKAPVVLTVTCQARFDVADADIMFVLDTTGSMACTTTSDSGSGCGASTASYTRPDGTTGYYDVEEIGSKISGLRSAVLSFYDTLTANADPTTHIRYGFVPYTSTVNAGYLLPQAALVTRWNYQTRQLVGDTTNGGASSTVTNQVSQANCAVGSTRTPATGYTSSGTATIVTRTWAAQSGNKAPGTCTVTTQPEKPQWSYGQYPLDVSGYITGAAVTDPTKVTGATSTWQGCLEERRTTTASTFDASNLPPDLDPDLPPVASVDSTGLPTSSDTRWRPMWPDVIYSRGNSLAAFTDKNSNSSNPYGDNSSYPNYNTPTYLSAGYISCGKPAQRLTTMTRTDVSNYVNASDFKAIGGTYHDTGMIWGTRLISPTGIFAADTAAWPGHQAPNRYIVFMTDGQMEPNELIYGMYGMELYDQRVVGPNYSLATDTADHNARFVAECAAAKARNITIFVVGFGQTLNSQLTACASPGDAYYASSNAALTTAFQSIANQVAMLRISQ